MQLRVDTRSYLKYEYKGFAILIFKQLKYSLKSYSYQARTKLVNIQKKNYTWYPVQICSIDEFDEKYNNQTEEQVVNNNIDLILDWHKELIDSKIKDFRFPN